MVILLSIGYLGIKIFFGCVTRQGPLGKKNGRMFIFAQAFKEFDSLLNAIMDKIGC